jgi:hypothetical protein
MKKFFAILPLVVWASAQAQTNINDRAPPPQLVLAKEFIREMRELEDLRVQGEKDLSRATNANEQLLSFIHWAASVQMASRTSVYMLKDVKLNGDNHDTPALLAQAHEARIEILEHMKDLDKQILKGPQPGVDYSQIMTDMTESRAALEQLNSSLVKSMSALVFVALVDAEHPDSQNHVSYLIISRKEKRELVKSLDFTTGSAGTNSPFQNAGGVIYDYLVKKRFKCADERQL